jgi:uncharacterized protein YqgC (DUF456 family)
VTQPTAARKVFDWIAGVGLILLGTAGLVLPVLPGVLLIIAGIAILSSHSTIARRIHSAMVERAKRMRDRVLNRD